jgi:hypothetical protein
MPAHILRDLLQGEIEALLPPRALEVAKVAEASEKDLLSKLAHQLSKKPRKKS